MSKVSPVCVQCGGTMEDGFILDRTEGGAFPSTWVEGKPQPSFWRGTNITGKERLTVQAFRCLKCGRIDLYAHEPRE